MKTSGIAAQLFELELEIRYVAVNEDHRMVEMARIPKWPTDLRGA